MVEQNDILKNAIFVFKALRYSAELNKAEVFVKLYCLDV